MKNLIIEHKGQALTRKIIGGLWIIMSIIIIIVEKNPQGHKQWAHALLFFIMGVLFFTPLVGSTKSQIEICEGCLKIIWMNWITPVTIAESEIEKIVFGQDGIKIFRKDKRPVKLLFYTMVKEQKTIVYEFFTEYAREKNFVLGR
jgi:hypothetical protein